MLKSLKDKFNFGVCFVGMVATILVIYQFLFRQGLWDDELLLTDNFVPKGFIDLLKPLDNRQVAPIMFLWIEKGLLVLADLIHQNWADYFLRLYPLFCGFGVIFLYYKLAFKLTGSKAISLISYALLVLNPIFIYYSSEVKQYICELFYAILLVYIWARYTESNWNMKKTFFFLGIVLLSIFNSSTICFVIFPLALYDGWHLLTQNHWNIKKLCKDKQVLFYIFRYLLCLIFLAEYYFLFLYNHPSSEFVHRWWKDFFANTQNIFPILDETFTWLFLKQINSFVFFIGIITLLKLQSKKAFILSLFTIIISIAFSYFELYPIYQRLTLYWLTFLPICLASLFVYLFDISSSIRYKIFSKSSIFFIMFFITTSFYFTFKLQSSMPIYLYNRYPKQALEIIKTNYDLNDLILIHDSYSSFSYLKKYYIKIPNATFLSIRLYRNYEFFLKKSIQYISSTTKFKRIWVLPNTEKNITSYLDNNLFNMLKSLKDKFNWGVCFVGMAATILVIYQFLFRRGLWLDELFVADNLVQKNFIDLLKPLERNQVAPIMFLWLEKGLLILADLIHQNWADYFLRLYPLACSFGVIFLYYKLAFKLTGSKAISLIAYAFLVLNPKFIYYSSEVKQYICELFYAILLVYIWARYTESNWNMKKTFLFLGIVLLSILNSSTICFVIFPLALYDGWHLLTQNHWNIKKLCKDKQVLFYIFRYLLCLIFLAGYYFLFLHNHPTSEFMYRWWKEKNSFVNVHTILPTLNQVISWLSWKMNVLVFIMGFLTLLKLQNKRIFVLSLFTIIITVVFSHFSLYPIYNRLTLYWLFFLPICLASLFVCVYQSSLATLSKKNQKIILPVFLCLGITYYFTHNYFPVYLFDKCPKRALSIIEKKYTQGDLIIFQRLYLPHSYILKYYIHSIPEDVMSDIEEEDWHSFLKKSIKHISLLKDKTRIWIIFNTGNSKEITKELSKNKLFNELQLKVPFCKRSFRYQAVCLIEPKAEKATD